MSTATTLETPATEIGEDDTVELHVRNVPRSVWLKARQAALVSRLRFGRYVTKLLENAGPLPPSLHPNPNPDPNGPMSESLGSTVGGSTSPG